jgi:hypothetical protein
LEVIKEAGFPCRIDSKKLPCHQKFNNGAIYANNQDEDDESSPIEWKNGMKNFQSFFNELSDMRSKSLQMTIEVLEYRKQLEMKLRWTKDAIPKHLTKMEELRTKESFIELHKMEVDANQNFEIKSACLQESQSARRPPNGHELRKLRNNLPLSMRSRFTNGLVSSILFGANSWRSLWVSG